MVFGGTWQQEEKAGASKLHQAAAAAFEGGLAGLAASSMAITLAVCEPLPGLDKGAYLLALTGAFFAGVAQVIAAVWVFNNSPLLHRAAGRKLMCASIAPLAVVVGLSVATLLW